ncbi:MAG: hypothetical protein RMM17_13765 [Acidobacteriota bacterium]|nr:hypothetical protein [Blastocatellia bacterium]MDW8413735.1 hypothetical protein [Acidobacteriota bacterium]
MSELDDISLKETYKIISVLLEQVEASNNLIALMAAQLGEENTRKITQSSSWAAFMTAKRSLETLRPLLEKYVATAAKMTAEM